MTTKEKTKHNFVICQKHQSHFVLAFIQACTTKKTAMHNHKHLEFILLSGAIAIVFFCLPFLVITYCMANFWYNKNDYEVIIHWIQVTYWIQIAYINMVIVIVVVILQFGSNRPANLPEQNVQMTIRNY